MTSEINDARAPLPIVALVGRPNVGKSRTFNRLVGHRAAIVDDTPGVTRDRNYARVDWDGCRFLVIDTGGFEPASEDALLEQMREQAQLAIEEADAIVFLLDGQSGRLPGDELIAQILREAEKPLIAAVNKLDTEGHIGLLSDFYPLGLDDLIGISAEHGRGFDVLMDCLAEKLPASEEEQAGGGDDSTQIAVIGKPNTGKSTLVNRLLGSERLLTSMIPGTTRDSIDTEIVHGDKRYVLIDTAGMRRKKNISLRLEKYSVFKAVRSIERADVALLMVDATLGVTDQDTRIARLAVDRGTALAILLNKWDLIADKTSQTAAEFEKELRHRLPFCEFAPVMTLSALSGQRVQRLFDLVDRLLASASVRIPTAELNRHLETVVARHKPPLVRNRQPRFYYITQVAVRPPTFVLQVNEPRGIDQSYRRYLENRLRDAFGFEGTPIRLLFRKPKGRHRWDGR